MVSYYQDVVNGAHSTETRTGAGAVSVATLETKVVSTGADALTLANGQVGQIKFITMQTDGGTATLAPTSLSGYASIAFDDVGDWVILRWSGLAWEIKASRGVTLNLT